MPLSVKESFAQYRATLGDRGAFAIYKAAQEHRRGLGDWDERSLGVGREVLGTPVVLLDPEGARQAREVENARHLVRPHTQAEDELNRVEERLRTEERHPASFMALHGKRAVRALAFDLELEERSRAKDRNGAESASPIPATLQPYHDLFGDRCVVAIVEGKRQFSEGLPEVHDDILLEKSREANLREQEALRHVQPGAVVVTRRVEGQLATLVERSHDLDLQAQQLEEIGWRLDHAQDLRQQAEAAREEYVALEEAGSGYLRDWIGEHGSAVAESVTYKDEIKRRLDLRAELTRELPAIEAPKTAGLEAGSGHAM